MIAAIYLKKTTCYFLLITKFSFLVVHTVFLPYRVEGRADNLNVFRYKGKDESYGDYKGLYDCKTLVERDLKMVGIEQRERRTVNRYRPVYITVNRYKPVYITVNRYKPVYITVNR